MVARVPKGAVKRLATPKVNPLKISINATGSNKKKMGLKWLLVISRLC